MSASAVEASIMKNVWYRLIGVRGGPASMLFQDQIYPSTKDASNFGQVFPQHDDASQEIARHRLVFLGEIHSMPPIIAFQRQVQREMNRSASKLHVIMEHFSFEMQPLLDRYTNGSISFEELNQEYHEHGSEGHFLEPYKGLLEDARSNGVQLHAGFIPRPFAKKFIQENPEKVLEEASEWLKSPIVGLEGSETHYNVFESLISGRSLYNDKTDGLDDPTDQFRRIFKAQILKDVAMANKVNHLIKDASSTTTASSDGNNSNDEKFLVIAGNGHFLHYCGVPERVLDQNPELVDDSCLVISASTYEPLEDENDLQEELIVRYGDSGSNPADYIYFYHQPEDNDDDDDELAIKEETRKAYDKVGESAALPGNALKAAWIMYSMGYSEEQFKVAGSDVYNFQGVGNPHIHANIKPGERVLDVGSGLGIDSFIATHATGPEGEVIGIDISAKEISHAQKRATASGLTKTSFQVADMEKIPLPDESIDVIISNGAFCLAPNKRKAFAELFRVLKPGGRISVCTTTTKMDNLEEGVNWPLCMRMFVAQKELQPMCEEVGFENILLDDTDSAMTMEIPEDVLQNANPERNRVHVGGDDFKHLENFDMDEICARVCISAYKPLLNAKSPSDLFPRSR